MSNKPIKNKFYTEHDDGSITFNGNLIVSDTPKTDSRAGDVNYKGDFVYCDDGQLVEIEFARQLERENDALREQIRLVARATLSEGNRENLVRRILSVLKKEVQP